MHEHGVEIVVVVVVVAVVFYFLFYFFSLISWFSYKLLYRLPDRFYCTSVIPFTK